MKYYRMIRSANETFVDEVEGKICKYCSTAYIYKCENNLYNLVDIDTGLAICCSKRLKDLEENYNRKKERYEEVRKSPKYKIIIERFERHKVAYHMKGGKQ